MKLHHKLTSIAVGLSLMAGAQSRKIDFEKYEMDNGLEVILHEDHSTPIVTVSVMYHVGSKNENPTRTGFAHFFEHLMFEGSENIERGEYMNIVQNSGGTLNANTTQDRTYYYQTLPSNQLKLGLWLESERMLHAKVDQEGVETQREVVKEERRQRYDNQPYGDFIEQMFSRAFTQHPYKWTPIGSMEHLNAASIDEFRDFYKTFYVPNNATMVISGDFESDEAKELIADYFKDIPKGEKEIPFPKVEPAKVKGPIVDTVYDEIQLPAVFTGYRIPKATHPDFYALSMLNSVLAGGESARLQRTLVDEKQLALQVGSFPYGLEDAGLFIFISLPNTGVDLTDLEDGIYAEIEKVKKNLVSEKEYQKIKNQEKADFVSSNSTTSGVANSLARYDVLYDDVNLINNEIDKYMEVTREDIQRVAKEYLTKENEIKLYYLPADQQNQ
jgi:predicted Zn-dependent peptidase